MAISFEHTKIRFSSGNEVYCYDGTFGLSPFDEPDEPDNSVSYGGDGGIDVGTAEHHDLSPADAVELADAMIARWQAFKNAWASQLK